MQLFINGGGIFDFCRSYPSVRFFIAPPNIRNKPSWYPRFRPTVLRVFQQVLSGRPQNLQSLEDYPGTLDNDGIHFNIMSGILYVQDMFDQSVQLMLQPSPDVSIRWAIILCVVRVSVILIFDRVLHTESGLPSRAVIGFWPSFRNVLWTFSSDLGVVLDVYFCA